jgi:hypothetical protein
MGGKRRCYRNASQFSPSAGVTLNGRLRAVDIVLAVVFETRDRVPFRGCEYAERTSGSQIPGIGEKFEESTQ